MQIEKDIYVDLSARQRGLYRALLANVSVADLLEKAVATLEAKKCFPPNTRRILDVLRFIENHILPLYTLEVLLVLSNLKSPINPNIDQSSSFHLPIDNL